MSRNSPEFEEAAKAVNKLTERPTNEELLDLYGYYKQATVGDCNTSRPWAIDLKGCAKWDKWNSHKGLSKAEAESKYITMSQTLCGKYPSS